ncbi:dolichyl-phosphate-mannose-proteinmannosyltransf erase [Halorhabdus utahensis DSM 12940]|uniref:Dolichyl-phosphate-mannose-proteinmannosyltransf erase n=1 Tax=Halorhabdus utahensis (strain DSM 12940 / JCM 11049 / AX-2) TaxID=519442 RepID=C7NUP6_HALUD|nr:glycosyltransferase family 39 protein [Halorhabdus utahensis]ACV12403.1 dolichyl-phosphate-mannose-proteinmannosyltransf erase [Halorhabdus utahensis DSM 12940]
MVPVRALLGRAKARVLDDLRTDPYLPALLVLAAVLSGFWFWHRLPNLATRDEWSRALDPLVAFRSVVADPSYEGLKQGVAWGRVPFGATFYLFGLALVPMIAVAVLTGNLDAITGTPHISWAFGHFPIWNEVPAWFWTGYIGLVRLFNVAFAVGSVYLTYRIATTIADRSTGRLAALFLTLTFGFLTIAHEGGEDMPALFFLLVALYLLILFVRSGETWTFYAASAVGGVAMAFKLTMAVVIALIALAHVLRAREREAWPRSLYRPRLIGIGAALGLLAIVVGLPTTLVGAFDPVLSRIGGHSISRPGNPHGPTAPTWWWFARGYFNGLGLPLLVGSVGGLVAALSRVGRRRANTGTLLVLATIGGFAALYVPWHDFRVHHLLPTFPLLAILVATWLVELRDRRETVARVLTVALIVSSGVYAGVGVAGYADTPRDQAAAWLDDRVRENETIETYRWHFQDTALPHGANVTYKEGEFTACPEYIMLTYRDLVYLDETYLRNSPRRQAYIRGLLDGESGYETVAEFGSRPPAYFPQRPTPGSLVDLLPYGIVPQVDQHADEQELRPNQFTVILQSTGECDADRDPPF